MRARVIIAAIAAFILLPATAASASSLGLINGERGGDPLQNNGSLASAAAAHSRQMADRGEIYHSPNLSGVVSGWSALGENVGVGASVGEVHAAFMASSGHRANILGEWTDAGVGTYTDENGAVWVTVIFMEAADGQSSSPKTTPPPVSKTSPKATSEPMPERTAPRSASVPVVQDGQRFGHDKSSPIAD